MDFKVKGYQSFQGEFLRTDVKVSQKIVDMMSDEDLMQLRAICSSFESELFNILKHYAAVALENEQLEMAFPETEASKEPSENEETNPENNEETNPENSLPKSRVTAKAVKKG